VLIEDSDIYKIYPIAWIAKSQTFVDHVSSIKLERELLVADFASGEHDRVPSFFVNVLPKLHSTGHKRTIVYCTDVHTLRLDSLMGKLEESDLLDYVRVVHAKLETMDEEACFRPDMIEYLERNPNTAISLDHHLTESKYIPQETFDVGVLNNDIVGYLYEYYAEYSDVRLGLQKVHKTLKIGALLVVTMPCSLYIVDNIQVLESLGFEFIEGLDFQLSDGAFTPLGRSAEPQTMSRLGHYTFLIFVRK